MTWMAARAIPLLRLRAGSRSAGRRGISALSQETRTKFLGFRGGSVSLRKDDASGIGELAFSHPGKRNSFSGEMMVALHDAVAELEAWPLGRALLVLSEGDLFCSGGDLDMMRALDSPEQGAQMAALMHDALTALHDLPLLSACLVQGRALGGGAELTTACDFRLMLPKAQIQFVQRVAYPRTDNLPQVRMGLVPGWGGTTRLVRLLGPSAALELLSSGRSVEAEEALRLGLADGLLRESEDPAAQARDWLRQHARGDPHTLKRTVVKARQLSTAEALAEERRLFATVWSGPANREVLDRKVKH
ncbi:hypothetical protein HPB47_027527 [Ixodes persulcatus]|uniref:Uncharacterized protein n=1 Tax=Ixodes persulcatus TaxID=34615 RepID=A0AC60PVL1_IXOPE|nr:hypothetical protein HPB47_027527 [Ixodes persulcatus]